MFKKFLKEHAYIFILLAALISLLTLEYLFFNFTIDDAFIGFRYSENMANGYGTVFNIGEKPVEGYSNFLWIMIGAAFVKMGFSAMIASKFMGIFFSLINIPILYKLSYRMLGNKFYASLPPLLLSVIPAYAFWAVAGLETILYITLLLISVLFFLEKKYLLSSLFFVLLSLTRPEGAVVFAVLSLLMLYKNKTAKARLFSAGFVKWIVVFAGIYVPYFIWRFLYFGYPLPNSFYFKSGVSSLSSIWWAYSFLAYIFPFAIFGVYGILKQKTSGEKKFLLALVALLVALTFLYKPIQGYPYRFLLPALPFILIFAADGIKQFLQSLGQTDISFGRQSGNIRKYLALAVVVFLFIYPLVNAREYKAYADKFYNGYERAHNKLGKWLSENFNQTATLVMADIGAAPYYAKMRTIDIVGVTDTYITHHAQEPGYAKYILDQNPDIIVLLSGSTNIFRPLWDYSDKIYNDTDFQKNFTRIAVLKFDNYYYLWVYKSNSVSIGEKQIEKLAYDPVEFC